MMPDMTLEQVVRIVVKTADSASESGHTEAEVVADNWDILGPILRKALAECVEDDDDVSLDANDDPNEWYDSN